MESSMSGISSVIEGCSIVEEYSVLNKDCLKMVALASEPCALFLLIQVNRELSNYIQSNVVLCILHERNAIYASVTTLESYCVYWMIKHRPEKYLVHNETLINIALEIDDPVLLLRSYKGKEVNDIFQLIYAYKKNRVRLLEFFETTNLGPLLNACQGKTERCRPKSDRDDSNVVICYAACGHHKLASKYLDRYLSAFHKGIAISEITYRELTRVADMDYDELEMGIIKQDDVATLRRMNDEDIDEIELTMKNDEYVCPNIFALFLKTNEVDDIMAYKHSIAPRVDMFYEKILDDFDDSDIDLLKYLLNRPYLDSIAWLLNKAVSNKRLTIKQLEKLLADNRSMCGFARRMNRRTSKIS